MNEEFEATLPSRRGSDVGSAGQALRVELSVYEGSALIDSASVDVQILDDPAERQNPMPDPGLLRRVAAVSGGKELPDAESLAAMIQNLPSKRSRFVVRAAPFGADGGSYRSCSALLTVDWAWRRTLGLA